MAWPYAIANDSEHESVHVSINHFCICLLRGIRNNWIEAITPFYAIHFILLTTSANGSIWTIIIKWWYVCVELICSEHRNVHETSDLCISSIFRVKGHRVLRQHWSIDPTFSEYICWPIRFVLTILAQFEAVRINFNVTLARLLDVHVVCPVTFRLGRKFI